MKRLDSTNFSFLQSKIEKKTNPYFEYDYHHNRGDGQILEIVMDFDYILEAHYMFLIKRKNVFEVDFPE